MTAHHGGPDLHVDVMPLAGLTAVADRALEVLVVDARRLRQQQAGEVTARDVDTERIVGATTLAHALGIVRREHFEVATDARTHAKEIGASRMSDGRDKRTVGENPHGMSECSRRVTSW